MKIEDQIKYARVSPYPGPVVFASRSHMLEASSAMAIYLVLLLSPQFDDKTIAYAVCKWLDIVYRLAAEDDCIPDTKFVNRDRAG